MSFNILAMESFNTYINNCRERVLGKENRLYLMGIAITWIFFYHFYCWYIGTRPWWIYFFSEGQTGVDIFLFISAYGLEASFRRKSWILFYKSRAKRILPVYLLFLFLIYAFIQESSVTKIVIQCIAQLTGGALFVKPDFFSTNFVFDWFTPALILFYLLFPIISYCLNYIAKQSSIIEITTLIILIIISYIALRNIHLPIKALMYRLPIIMLGCCTYIHLERHNYTRLLSLYIVAFIGGLLSNQHWFLTSTSIPILLTVYSLIGDFQPLRYFFCLLGRHSYEIYLAHIIPVTNFLMLYPIANIYLYILVTTIFTVVVATIFSLFHKYANILLNSTKSNE